MLLSDEVDLGAMNPSQREALATALRPLSAGQGLLLARWLLTQYEPGALLEDRLELARELDRSAPQGLTVLYGSHSDHSTGIARQLAQKARQKGWKVKLSNLSDYARGTLRREQNVVVVVSTHGDGQPPESAAAFFEFLHSERAPKLPNCAYAVLALGDKTYTHFCKAGVDIDRRLEQLGASRLMARVDLDVDYEEPSVAWIEQALAAFDPRMALQPSAPAVQDASSDMAPRKAGFGRDNPWMAELVNRVELSGRGSSQRFVHLEFSLEGSNIKYQPGDALGVRPENDPALVDELIGALKVAPDEQVEVAGQVQSLSEALRSRLELRKITPSALRKYAALGAKTLNALVANPEALTAYLDGLDWIDILRDHPVEISAKAFVALLPDLASRSYSIASSQEEHPDEVHLLVSRVDYTTRGRRHQGVASNHVAGRLQVGDRLPVWIEPNRQFRLPSDLTQSIVLIGAGTGVAPYRAFLQARAAAGSQGKTWVFFGNQRFRSDFTYQSEWLRWREQGALTRMDVAFSRDQDRKIYVTDRVRERGRELLDWIEQGARIYLCGDRAKLAAGVDRALTDVLTTHAGKTQEQATAYLEQLRNEQRYLKDVY